MEYGSSILFVVLATYASLVLSADSYPQDNFRDPEAKSRQIVATTVGK